MFYTVLSFTYRSWWGGDVGDDDEDTTKVVTMSVMPM